jgi:hypothetical protein
MPDLSAYQDFNVKLDYINNQIVLTDPNGYPVGVDVDLVGIFTIIQPDRVSVTGSFSSPDVSYNSGQLTPAEKTLRLNSRGNPQCGTYSISYTIDHPDYTPTTITKTFELNYTRKSLDLEEDFDVFTPSLIYRDNTNFSQSGFTTTSSTVAWSAVIALVGTATGSSNNFDLIYSGNYYDAEYTIDYQRDLLYTHQTYTYLTLADRYSTEISTTANTPPSVNDLIACINALKAELDDAAGNCGATALLEERYKKAMVRYDHLIHKLRVGDADDAEDLLAEIISLTRCANSVNRGQVIQPYDISVYSGGAGSDDYYYYTLSADVTEITLSAMNGKVIKAIDMDGIGRQFSAGADGDTPADGRFVVVTGSLPRKFKFGGTMYEGQWLRIKYSNS